MILLKLLLTFIKIGIFNFGGGYAALSLIQLNVVEKYGWLTTTEFTDIVAISQMTPGPIGINCATFVGYSATINSLGANTPIFMGTIGSIIASLSIILLPFLLTLIVSRFLIKHSKNDSIQNILSGIRPTVIGIILSAVIMLLNRETFGSATEEKSQFIVSILLFIGTFIAAKRFKLNPILLICLAGGIGFIIYGLLGV